MNIAVILPVYNPNIDWLTDSITALHSQGVNVTLFIGFDGYTPPSDFLLRLYKNKINIKQFYYRHSGLTKTLNKLIIEIHNHNIEFDFIARLDADDVYLPNKLKHQAEYMKIHKLDLSGTNAQILTENNMSNVLLEYGCKHTVVGHISNETIGEALEHGNCIIHSSILVSQRLFYSGEFFYNTLFRAAQDYELWLRLKHLGYKIGVYPKVCLQYRQSRNQITSSKKDIVNKNVRMIKEFYRIYGKN